jgi:hypothetical protein
MALQPNSGPGLPFWGFVTITFLRVWIVGPAPNPQPGGPGLSIYDPRRQGGQAIPQALGTHFSHLLRNAWVTVDRLCGLVVSVEDYKHRGPGFDSRALIRIFLRELGLERGPLSLVIG